MIHDMRQRGTDPDQVAPRTPPTPVSPTSPQHSREPRQATRPGRVFEAVSKGESFEAEIHPSLADDDMVLEIDAFNLYYGQSRALWDVSMTIPRARQSFSACPSPRCKDTPARPRTRRRARPAEHH